MSLGKEHKVVAKCPYCNDPIYDNQLVSEDKEGRKAHSGCYKIWIDGIERAIAERT